MWIFTTFGFFSIVKKPNDPDQPEGGLCIRARDRGDLESLKQRYLPGAGRIIYTHTADYPFRMYAKAADIAVALAEATQDIEYSNFKSEVGKEQGHERSSIYARVWCALLDLEEWRRRRWSFGAATEKKGKKGKKGKKKGKGSTTYHPQLDFYDDPYDDSFGSRVLPFSPPQLSPAPAPEREIDLASISIGRPTSEGRFCMGDQGCDPCDPLCGDDPLCPDLPCMELQETDITVLGDDIPEDPLEESAVDEDTLVDSLQDYSETCAEDGACYGDCNNCLQYDTSYGCRKDFLNYTEEQKRLPTYLDPDREQFRQRQKPSGFLKKTTEKGKGRGWRY